MLQLAVAEAQDGHQATDHSADPTTENTHTTDTQNHAVGPDDIHTLGDGPSDASHGATGHGDTHAGTEAHHGGGHHGNMEYWQGLSTGAMIFNVLPFVTLLLMIAILPLIPKVDHWWHQNKNKLVVGLICAVLGVGLYLWPTGDWHKVLHTYIEYAAFITLLASLFIISGGIVISGPFAGFPHVNTLFLAIGAVLANFMGTTGASMLLIRPLLNANKRRKHKTHIMVFFIFVVSNCGGLLTPLGDPPLYMGFLRGVPFGWTLNLIPQWFMMVGLLLFVFQLLDSFMFSREDAETKESLAHSIKTEAGEAGSKLKIEGAFNLAFLGAVVAVILASGYIVFPYLKTVFAEVSNAEMANQVFQVVAMAIVTAISYKLTDPKLREANHFSFEPIGEVACVFVGIFGAMIPALTLLEAKGASLPVNTTWQYFWITGGLSGFLDNAPTYLTFVTLGASKSGLPSSPLTEFTAQHPEILSAISVGAVFMGALTYIGNGPNFMVKAIAEHANIKMPSFGGYILWSFSFLLPLLLLVTLVFYI